MRRGLVWIAILTCACGQTEPQIEKKELDASDVTSGSAFLTGETLALQNDDFANPGLLWVDLGADLFSASEKQEASCRTCHEDELKGVAATYPAIDHGSGRLLNLEGRINECRTKHQGFPAFEYESEQLLALTAYVAKQSSGLPIQVTTEGAEEEWQRGYEYFNTRRGQMNFSCHQCHTENWGGQLRGDTISQGHGNGFPAYRLEWQSLGSLHRRLRDCDLGVRAEPLPYGSDTYVALELYLAVRAQGLEMESPAVRR